MEIPGASTSSAPRLCLHASALRYNDAVASLPWPSDLAALALELRPMDPMARAAAAALKKNAAGAENHQRIQRSRVKPWVFRGFSRM
jgi:hypothetical protein